MGSYDRLDWHYDSAIEAGQPPEHAFTHIGFYLAWIIRHDLHNPEMFPASHVDAVKGGEMTGSDLSDDIDTKLLPHDMNAEGRAFSDARYAAYLAEYAKVFADEPEYSVVDEPANYARIAPVIDSMYASWIADGRPEAVDETPELPAGLDFFPDMARAQIDSMVDRVGRELRRACRRRARSRGHVSDGTELEALIPSDLTDPPPRINSVRASTWGSSLLNRALRRLEVDPSEATVVVAMGGRGERTLTVMLYKSPTSRRIGCWPRWNSAITLPREGVGVTVRSLAGRSGGRPARSSTSRSGLATVWSFTSRGRSRTSSGRFAVAAAMTPAGPGARRPGADGR